MNPHNKGKSKYDKTKCRTIGCSKAPVLDKRGVVSLKGYCQKCWGLIKKPEHLRNQRYTRKEYDLTKCINFDSCGNPPKLYVMKGRTKPIAHRKGMCASCWNNYVSKVRPYTTEQSRQKALKRKQKRISFNNETLEADNGGSVVIKANRFELAKKAKVDIQIFDKTLIHLKEDGHILDFSIDKVTQVVTITVPKTSYLAKILI